jgi:hypothetical protein
MKTKHKSKKKHLNFFENFINDADVVFLSRTLRDMLLDYIVFNKEALPIDFDLSIYQLSLLFKLLDRIEDENQKNTT